MSGVYRGMVRRILVVVIALLIVGSIVIVLTRSAVPVLDVVPPVTVLGQATPIAVQVHDPHGVRSLTAFVEQNGSRYQVAETAERSTGADRTWNFTAGVKTTPQMKDGKAKLVVEATSNDLLHKSGHWEGDVTVITQPPSVTADTEQHYLYLGMADLATLTVSGNWTEAGVRVGDEKFRAWPMPPMGQETRRPARS